MIVDARRLAPGTELAAEVCVVGAGPVGLAVAEALGCEEVEVAYIFLERPAEPAVSLLGPTEMTAARAALEQTISRIGNGDFPVAAPEERDWSLCRGCPALRGLCSGPEAT